MLNQKLNHVKTKRKKKKKQQIKTFRKLYKVAVEITVSNICKWFLIIIGSSKKIFSQNIKCAKISCVHNGGLNTESHEKEQLMIEKNHRSQKETGATNEA